MSRPSWKQQQPGPGFLSPAPTGSGASFLRAYACVAADVPNEGRFSSIHIFAKKSSLAALASSPSSAVQSWRDLPHKDVAVVKVSESPKRRQNAINLRREIAIHWEIFHPCIVRIDAVLSADDLTETQTVTMHGQPNAPLPELKGDSLVLEYCPGGTLQEYLDSPMARVTNENQAIIEEFTDRCIAQLCAGILHLHRLGILHRDIKLSNVLVATDKERESCGDIPLDSVLLKIADLGLSKFDKYEDLYKAVEEEEQLKSARRMHTPAYGKAFYHAPEVVQDQPYGFPADMWSLGMVIFYLVFRDQLFPTSQSVEHLKQLQRNVSIALTREPEGKYTELLQGLLQYEPQKRWTAFDVFSNCDFLEDYLEKHHVATSDDVDSERNNNNNRVITLLDLVDEDQLSVTPKPIFDSNRPRLSTAADKHNLCYNVLDQFQIKDQGTTLSSCRRGGSPSTVSLALLRASLLIQKSFKREDCGLAPLTAIVASVERGHVTRGHPHIVEVHDIIAVHHSLHPSFGVQIFVEYCRGEDLPDFLNFVKKLSQGSFLSMVGQLYSALLHLHSRQQYHGAVAMDHVFVTSRNPKLAMVKLSEAYLLAGSLLSPAADSGAKKDMIDFAALILALLDQAEVSHDLSDDIKNTVRMMKEGEWDVLEMYEKTSWLQDVIHDDRIMSEVVNRDLNVCRSLLLKEISEFSARVPPLTSTEVHACIAIVFNRACALLHHHGCGSGEGGEKEEDTQLARVYDALTLIHFIKCDVLLLLYKQPAASAGNEGTSGKEEQELGECGAIGTACEALVTKAMEMYGNVLGRRNGMPLHVSGAQAILLDCIRRTVRPLASSAAVGLLDLTGHSALNSSEKLLRLMFTVEHAKRSNNPRYPGQLQTMRSIFALWSAVTLLFFCS